jgi:hypothetical protein
VSSGCISQANAAARRLNAGDYILNDRPLLSGALGRLNGDKWATAERPLFRYRTTEATQICDIWRNDFSLRATQVAPMPG